MGSQSPVGVASGSTDSVVGRLRASLSGRDELSGGKALVDRVGAGFVPDGGVVDVATVGGRVVDVVAVGVVAVGVVVVPPAGTGGRPLPAAGLCCASPGPATSHQTRTVSSTVTDNKSNRRTQYTFGGNGPEGRMTVLTGSR